MMTSVEIKRSFAKLGHQRVLKLRGDAQQIFVNGEFSGGASGFWDYTVYVIPYMVVRPEGHYTKHIYVNSERIASKIGNPENFGAGDPTGQGDAVGRKIKMEEVVEENYNELFGSVPEIEPAAEEQLGMSSGSSEPELNSYWFTSDHLGSSAFVTDGSGLAIQHLEYMAFGEVFVDQRRTGFGTPYKFNAKELDCESGYYYYSARYYDPRMARFLSVDPLAGEMPEWGSYTYTFNNPLRYIDPTGMGPEDCPNCPKNDERYDYFRESKANYDFLGNDQVANKDNGEIEAIGPLATVSAPEIGYIEQAWNSNLVRSVVPDYISIDLGKVDLDAFIGMSIGSKSFTILTRGDDIGLYYTPNIAGGISPGINGNVSLGIGGGYYTGHPSNLKYNYLSGGSIDISGDFGLGLNAGSGITISPIRESGNALIGGTFNFGLGGGAKVSAKYQYQWSFPLIRR